MISIPENTSILFSRTDSIGDVMLTIPLTAFLKKHFPKNKIVFLCSSYTAPILQHIQTIDEIIIYNEIQNITFNQTKNIFSQFNIHTAIIVFPTFEISKLLFKLKIPVRIATSHRLYNWLFCNQLVSFTRKNSDLHEAQLNFKLLKPLGFTDIPSLDDLKQMYYWKNIPPLSNHLKSLLSEKAFKIIIHPKSKGSAREWPIENYIKLIHQLNKKDYQIIITGTKNEEPYLKQIFDECPDVLNLVGKTSLQELLSLIKECDALIAASTGTLHIAATLGKYAIGLFPSIRPMHAGRWAPLGKNSIVLQKPIECNDCKKSPESCHCIQSISPEQVRDIIHQIFIQSN
jgi:ADP-heptose:LPS heptosyltransferase